MANIYPPSYPQHHPLDFHPRPVNHSPSTLGFGFGFATASPSFPTLSPGAFSPHNQAAHRPHKRRLETEEDDGGRRGDDAMDRSPTPERVKRAPPKRLRITPTEAPVRGDKESADVKENKPPSSDVDVGVLLASLPQQSLLPLMMALLREQPSLKTTVLSLLPRPTLEMALQALSEASKTLREAYPYSAPVPTPTRFGNSSGAFSPRSSVTGFGLFGRAIPQSQLASQSTTSHGGMRESYIVSRLRPHISEFVSACFSYLPYFSYISSTPNSPQPQLSSVKPHASETFTFLSTLTSHVFSQPQLTQNELSPLLTPRLLREWNAWVDRVDEILNRQGGMFSAEVARGWERSLDEFADKGGAGMKEIRDRWVAQVGWLVGRRIVMNMEEDQEL